jgi:CubicO group peptidase (beta-lactamase class C family)
MDWKLIEEKISTRMKTEHIPGAAVAISKNGRIIYQKGFGVKDLESNDQITPETIFGIASVSKSFTALAIMKLEEEGKLSIHDPVIKYLPEFNIPTIDPIESIKIHHLLTHTTGLAPLHRKEELTKFQEHLTYLSENEHDLLGKPGEYFSYCNDTFLLLGAIIERITGSLFRRYITEELLNPLCMYRSTYSLEEINKLDNVSTPYVYDRKREEYQKQPWPTLGNYEVGGGIRSTVLDLLKYGELYVNSGVSNGKTFISGKQLEKMWQPYFQLDRNSYYGYALKVTSDYHGVTLVEHSGGQPGVSANFGFIPELNLVAAVLTNVSDASASEIWLEAINSLLGLPLEERRSTEPYVKLSEDKQKRFVGTYQSKEETCLQIVWENSQLKAILDNEIRPLRTSDENTLVMMDNEKPIHFYFNQENKPWAALFGMRMLLKVNEG